MMTRLFVRQDFKVRSLHTEILTPLNNVGKQRRWCHGFGSFWLVNWLHWSEKGGTPVDGCRSTHQTLWHHRGPPPVWLILKPEGATVVCSNSYRGNVQPSQQPGRRRLSQRSTCFGAEFSISISSKKKTLIFVDKSWSWSDETKI